MLMAAPAPGSPSVCMLTSRRFVRYAYQAAVFEAQDVLCATAEVDLVELEPRPGFDRRESIVRRLLWHDPTGLLSHANPGLVPIRLARQYDLFIAFCPAIRDLLHVNAVLDRADHCATSVCFLDELWANGVRHARRYLDVLRRFDHVFVGLEGTVAPVSELIGKQCHFLPSAVDALRFTPYPAPGERVVDVYSFGRRREAVHQALLQFAAARRMFYLHETLEGGSNVVSHPGQHRDQIAGIAKRSRFITVAPAKFDRPDERGAQAELSNRYYEGAAAGAVLIGEAPDCPSFRALFDWPEAVVALKPDGSDTTDVLGALLEHPERMRAIGARNAAQALRRHDWLYRWKRIFEVAGHAPTPAMRARERLLHGLAGRAEEEALAAA